MEIAVRDLLDNVMRSDRTDSVILLDEGMQILLATWFSKCVYASAATTRRVEIQRDLNRQRTVVCDSVGIRSPSGHGELRFTDAGHRDRADGALVQNVCYA